jgi:predicted alpha/beta-fold hydrolase
MQRVRTLREFDDVVTATYCGFSGASDYYERSSALRVVDNIKIPALIMTAQDDPFVPFESFSDPALTNNSHVTLVAPAHGGHCAFISRHRGENRYWAEAKIMEFCKGLSSAK